MCPSLHAQIPQGQISSSIGQSEREREKKRVLENVQEKRGFKGHASVNVHSCSLSIKRLTATQAGSTWSQFPVDF